MELSPALALSLGLFGGYAGFAEADPAPDQKKAPPPEGDGALKV